MHMDCRRHSKFKGRSACDAGVWPAQLPVLQQAGGCAEDRSADDDSADDDWAEDNRKVQGLATVMLLAVVLLTIVPVLTGCSTSTAGSAQTPAVQSSIDSTSGESSARQTRVQVPDWPQENETDQTLAQPDSEEVELESEAYSAIQPRDSEDSRTRNQDSAALAWSAFLPHKINYDLRLRQSLPASRGFTRSVYTGSPLALRQNLLLEAPRLRAAIRLEKDEGESRLDDSGGGFLSLQHKNSKLILGDFRPQHGLGLLFGPAFGLRRSAEHSATIAVARQRVRGLSGNLEAGFLRGAQLAHTFGTASSLIDFSLFYSRQNLAATTKEFADGGGEFVSSLYTAGLFRSQTEQQKRNKLTQKIYGFTAGYANDKLNIQLASYRYVNSLTVTSQAGGVLPGQRGTLASLAATLKHNSNYLAAEILRDANQNYAWTLRWFKQFKKVRAQIFMRDAPPEVRSAFGANLGRRASLNNERGILAALRWRISGRHELALLQDLSAEHAPSSNNALPGAELISEVHYRFKSQPLKLSAFYVHSHSRQFRTETATSFDPAESKATGRKRHQLRLDLRNYGKKQFNWRLAFAWQYLEQSPSAMERSYYLRASCNFRLSSWLELRSDLVYFHSPTYSGALWVLSQSGMGTYLPTAVFETGLLGMAALDIRPFKEWRLLALCNLTRKHQTESIGSGNNYIEDNTAGRLTLQLRYRLNLRK